ncbi:MAG TPA: cob(I)yrinic acid a,c-diamide adenosyltransferase [Polyangiaceae bacterium]|nr:cob(I)yrinic acid a,c-diamide adenosyltransferase [Polyangiaceae bacterium]
MKIYTKTGDDGTTGLYGGERVAKDHPRITTCGALDELNAVLGGALCLPLEPDTATTLAKVQNDLFTLGAELATPGDHTRKLTARSAGVSAADIAELEHVIDQKEAVLPALKQFILPGGSEAAARLHLARAVCRRAERALITLHREYPVRQEVLIYVNRLSDLLFVLARFANHHQGVADVPWQAHSS